MLTFSQELHHAHHAQAPTIHTMTMLRNHAMSASERLGKSSLIYASFSFLNLFHKHSLMFVSPLVIPTGWHLYVPNQTPCHVDSLIPRHQTKTQPWSIPSSNVAWRHYQHPPSISTNLWLLVLVMRFGYAAVHAAWWQQRVSFIALLPLLWGICEIGERMLPPPPVCSAPAS